MFRATVMCGYRAYDWKTIAIWRALGGSQLAYREAPGDDEVFEDVFEVTEGANVPPQTVVTKSVWRDMSPCRFRAIVIHRLILDGDGLAAPDSV